MSKLLSRLSAQRSKKLDHSALFTSADVENYHNEAVTNYTIEKELISEKEEYLQTERELKIIGSASVCPSKINKNFNIETLKDLAETRFYNQNVMTALMCITDSIIYNPYSVGEKSSKIRKWISNLKQIGSESVSGYALKASFGEENKGENNEDDLFILKVSRNQNSNDEIIHELFVGRFCLNPLRDFIPNFAYVYGIFQCSPPIIDSTTKKVLSWCVTEGKTNYLIMENISPSISLRDYVKSATPKEFISAYLQILFSLRTSFLKTDFTHYDLHDSNVLMREFLGLTNNDNFQIPYETSSGKVYLTTNRIATIIDYGRVHVKYKNENYGFWGLPQYFISAEKSFILYDAYKLLGYCMYTMYTKNVKTGDSYNYDGFLEGVKILKFFNDVESPMTVMLDQSLYYFCAPPTELLLSKSIDNLIDHVLKVCDCSSFLSSSLDLDTPVLSCNNDSICLVSSSFSKQECIKSDVSSCLNFDNVMNMIETEISPTNLFDFCELYNNYLQRGEPFNEISENFDRSEAYDNALRQFFELRNKYKRIDPPKYIPLPEVDIEYKLQDTNFFNSYKANAFNIAERIDIIIEMKRIIDAYECVVDYYSDYNRKMFPDDDISDDNISDDDSSGSSEDYEIDRIESLFRIVDDEISSIEPYIKQLFADITTLELLDLKSYLPKEFSWYWTTFKNFKMFHALFD
jgi:hypothetical protein